MLLFFFFVDDARDLVKVRNSLLFRLHEPSDFDWKPDNPPKYFQRESGSAPSEIISAVKLLLPSRGPSESPFQSALKIADHLVANRSPSAVPIQSTTLQAYRGIRGLGNGYCADYTQVFNGIAFAAKVPVREWGVSFDGFGGDGHAFTEIYEPDLRKWIFIDSFYSFYVTSHSGEPLSALEFQKVLQSDTPLARVKVVPISSSKFAFHSPQRAINYYRRGAHQFFLILGNNVFSYENHKIVRLLRPLSPTFEQITAIALGIYPKIAIVEDDVNKTHLAVMEQVRAGTIIFVLSTLYMAVYLLLQSRETFRRVANRKKNAADVFPSTRGTPG